MAEHRGPMAWLRSVRVRLTLAAVVATALAVTSAGWLLVRSVEDTQTARVRDSAEDLLDDVAAALERGAPPEVAILEARRAVRAEAAAAGVPTFVQVTGEGGTMAVDPLLPDASGDLLAVTIDGSTMVTHVRAGDPRPPAPGTEPGGQPPPTAGATTGSDGNPPSTSSDDQANQHSASQDDVSAPGPTTDTADPPAADGSDPPASADSAASDGPPATGGTDPFTEPLDPGDAPSLGRQVTLVGPDTFLSFEPEQISRTVDTPTGEVTVFAAAPVDEVQENLDAVRRGLWIGVPLLVVAVAVVAWHLVGRALRPVEAIRSEVAAIGGTTMHRRVPTPENDDEIGRLAHTMNGMLDRLQAAATRQRQFVSDASHELRSPVTAIRTDVEVALREGASADWPAVGAAVLAEEARLERLLDDLLTLAAADEDGAAPPGDEHVAVDDLVADVVARPRRVPVRRAGRIGADGATDADAGSDDDADADTNADPDADSGADSGDRADADAGSHDRGDAGGNVDVDMADHPSRGGSDVLAIAGRSDQLARMLTNLVDNAARHATSAVEVGAAATTSPAGDPAVHLVVDDDGPGVPAADRVRVFERFARLDDGRTRDRGGTGLGLAVVRSIALAHRGRVWIDDSPLGGARFVVELPLAPLDDGRDAGAGDDDATRPSGGRPSIDRASRLGVGGRGPDGTGNGKPIGNGVTGAGDLRVGVGRDETPR